MEKQRGYLMEPVPGNPKVEVKIPGGEIGPAWQDCMIRVTDALLYIYKRADGTNFTVDDGMVINGERLTRDREIAWIGQPGHLLLVTFAQGDAIYTAQALAFTIFVRDNPLYIEAHYELDDANLSGSPTGQKFTAHLIGSLHGFTRDTKKAHYEQAWSVLRLLDEAFGQRGRPKGTTRARPTADAIREAYAEIDQEAVYSRVTLQDVADHLDVSLASLKRAIAAGEITWPPTTDRTYADAGRQYHGCAR